MGYSRPRSSGIIAVNLNEGDSRSRSRHKCAPEEHRNGEHSSHHPGPSNPVLRQPSPRPPRRRRPLPQGLKGASKNARGTCLESSSVAKLAFGQPSPPRLSSIVSACLDRCWTSSEMPDLACFCSTLARSALLCYAL